MALGTHGHGRCGLRNELGQLNTRGELLWLAAHPIGMRIQPTDRDAIRINSSTRVLFAGRSHAANRPHDRPVVADLTSSTTVRCSPSSLFHTLARRTPPPPVQ